MTKVLLFLCLTMALTAGLGSASTCASTAPANYSTLIATGFSCTINDLLFSGFVFAGSSTGTGVTPTAGQVSYTLDNPGTSTGTGQTIWGFEFSPNLSVVGIGSEDIQIQYVIRDLLMHGSQRAGVHSLGQYPGNCWALHTLRG